MADRGLLNDLKSASPARQLAMVIALGVAIALLAVALWFGFLRAPYRPLFSDLRVADAATIVAELERQKVPFALSEGGTSILVPADRVDATRLSVMSQDLPIKGTVGFELFNKSDMGLTDFAQKINYQRALQGELARTIMTLDNVDSARVHLAMGEDRLFRDDQVPPKASVTLRMKNGDGVAQDIALGIQRLVAAAVPKLDTANVAIIDEAGQVVVGVQPQAADAGASSPFIQQKRAIEQYYEGRIRSAIERVYPGGLTNVAVRAAFTSVGTGTAGGRGDQLEWNPANRRFALQIILESAAAADASVRTDMENVVAGTVGVRPELGDSIAFGPVPDIQPVAPSPVPAVRRPAIVTSMPPTSTAAVGSMATVTLLALLAGFAVLLVAVVAWRRRRVAPLDADQRAAFATQLKELLERDKGTALDVG